MTEQNSANSVIKSPTFHPKTKMSPLVGLYFVLLLYPFEAIDDFDFYILERIDDFDLNILEVLDYFDHMGIEQS